MSFNWCIRFQGFPQCTGTFGWANFESTYQVDTTPVDLTIARVEAVQVVQDEAESVPLIGDKFTMIRVFPKADRLTPNVSGRVTGPGGEEFPLVNGPITVTKTFDRDSEDHSLNFRVPVGLTKAGSISIKAEVNHLKSVIEPDYSNNSRTKGLTFKPSAGLNLGFVEVCTKDTSGTVQCPIDLRNGDDQYLKEMYPLAPANVKYYPLAKQAINSTEPVVTQKDLVMLLKRAGEKFARWPISKRPDQFVLVLPRSVATSSNKSGMSGGELPTVRQAVIAITEASTPSRLAPVTLAHETAHNYGLRHINRELLPVCTLAKADHPTWPYNDVFIHGNGFQMDEKGQLFRNSVSFELMGYCPDFLTWISPDTYKALEQQQFLFPFAGGVETQQVVIAGTVFKEGARGTIDPGFQILSSETPMASEPGGTHCLHLLAGASVVGSHCFTPEFDVDSLDDPLDEVPFVFRLAAPSGVTQILLKRGDTELARRDIGGAPSVAISSPKAGDVWSGLQTIRWTGSGLVYAVEISGDGGVSWQPAGFDTTDTSLTINSADFGGGRNAMVRVHASNGYQTTTAVAGPFSVGTTVTTPSVCVGCETISK